MKLVLGIAKWTGILVALIAVVGALIAWYLHTPISAERMARLERSEHYADGTFFNEERQAESSLSVSMFREQFFGEQQRVPLDPVPVEPVDSSMLQRRPSEGLRAIWLGHASVLLEIDGYRILTDPVLGERASPFSFLGPLRTHSSPIELDQLAGIDAVVISHNHYDHLEESTIRHLAAQGTLFFVPLGVGQYLEDWGVAAEQMRELEWGQTGKVGDLTIIATPSRHYSSRGVFDYKATHWSSWALKGDTHSAFYSGDTGYSNLFEEIGNQYGPFDLTVLKVGSYGPGQAWLDVHMTPEDAVRVHRDLGGRHMLPVHWMTFNLAMHDWDEPIVRALEAAKMRNVEIATPRIGEVVDFGQPVSTAQWWAEMD